MAPWCVHAYGFLHPTWHAHRSRDRCVRNCGINTLHACTQYTTAFYKHINGYNSFLVNLITFFTAALGHSNSAKVNFCTLEWHGIHEKHQFMLVSLQHPHELVHCEQYLKRILCHFTAEFSFLVMILPISYYVYNFDANYKNHKYSVQLWKVCCLKIEMLMYHKEEKIQFPH